MYAKIIDGQVAKYPYTAQELYEDNPRVSFPQLTDEVLAQFNAARVVATNAPEIDDTKNVNEGDPAFSAERNRWEQTWVVTDASPEEISQREAKRLARLEGERAYAYRTESDPLFFKAQRGEATQQEWLDKVAEIKARYA